MIRTLLLLVAAAVLAVAQEGATAPKATEWESKIVPVKYLTAGKGNSLALTLQKLVEPKGTVYYDSMMDLFVVKGTPDAIATAERIIARFDVPTPGETNRLVQYTAYLIEGSADGPRGQTLPATLDTVLQQMRATFPFKVYRLIDTIVFTGRTNGGTETSGILPTFTSVKDNPIIYQVKCGKAVPGDTPKTLNITDFRFGMRIPYAIATSVNTNQFQYADTGINTNLTISEGQKLVIGKLSAGLTDSAMFLILTVKID